MSRHTWLVIEQDDPYNKYSHLLTVNFKAAYLPHKNVPTQYMYVRDYYQPDKNACIWPHQDAHSQATPLHSPTSFHQVHPHHLHSGTFWAGCHMTNISCHMTITCSPEVQDIWFDGEVVLLP